MTRPVFTRGDWEEIGDGIKIRRVFRDGVIEALDWDHQCVNPADDYVPLHAEPAPGRPVRAHSWQIHSEHPLTISPSLLCCDSRCQRHGFIRDGKWVPA